MDGFELDVQKGALNFLGSQELLGLLVETFRPYNTNRPELKAIEKLLCHNGLFPYKYDVIEMKLKC